MAEITSEESYELSFTGDEINKAIGRAIKLTDETCNNLAGKKITVGKATVKANNDYYVVTALDGKIRSSKPLIFVSTGNSATSKTSSIVFAVPWWSSYSCASVLCRDSEGNLTRFSGTYEVDYIIIEE